MSSANDGSCSITLTPKCTLELYDAKDEKNTTHKSDGLYIDSISAPNDLEQPRKALSFDSVDPNLISNAIVSGDVGELRRLVQRGITSEAGYTGRPPLHLCAYLDQLSCLKVLLSHEGGAMNPNKSDEVRMRCSFHSQLDCNSILRDFQSGWVPIHDAVSSECALELIYFGANLELRTPGVR